MNKRPVSVTLIGVLFLLAGLVGVAYHATEFNLRKAGHRCICSFSSVGLALFFRTEAGQICASVTDNI